MYENKLRDLVIWAFIVMMVIVLCLSVSRERKNAIYISDLEQEVMKLETQHKSDTNTISDLQSENEMLQQTLAETLKMYNDAVDEAHNQEVKAIKQQSFRRAYKLMEE